ncbi:unnamed protein product [Angiostrongylus costaricensis]|uniref:Pyr_redox_2 domain-containing protein n=1 Tax=Angiostrongylus costaricensis TaxID=334426 RepID=A0A158PHG2_ANGCS|nr:unnamed protein product [Angiostrongylus costaricensis]
MIYVVVGGGIAGVSCTKRLLESINKSDHVILISASRIVKVVSNWSQIGRFSERFDVEECEMATEDLRFSFIEAKVNNWNYESKELLLNERTDPVRYDKLCIATGAQPIAPFSSKKRRLHGAKHVAVVGNGGIATEVVFEMRGVAITWIIRDDSISSVFFDTAISKFFQKRLDMGRAEGEKNSGVLKRLRYSLSEPSGKGTIQNLSGCALGPDWTSSFSFDCDSQGRNVNVIYNVEVQEVIDEEEGVVLSLSNGDQVQCDFVIWATGVVPTTSIWKNCCQEMRLWTQARQMGDYCARSMMVNGKLDVDFCFELFTHTTSFFGYKVCFFCDICFLIETIENLILNKTDLEEIEEDFLDPRIDIEDYFD